MGLEYACWLETVDVLNGGREGRSKLGLIFATARAFVTISAVAVRGLSGSWA